MLFWTLQITIISIILIFLVHNLIGFFKSTLTVPKIKDLVHAPAQKYETMINIMSNSNSNPYANANANANININVDNDSKYRRQTEPALHSFLTNDKSPDVSTMKNELKSFLKNKLKPAVENVTTLDSLDSNMNTLSYSTY